MRILRLRMVNYRRHRDTQVEFPDGVTAIVGRNGSGKTTIMEAIAFALYGTPATRTNKSLIRHDAAAVGDAVRVEVDAEVAGQAIAVVRELRGVHQTGHASLTIDGQTIVAPQAGSSEAVTDEITRRIGLDREAFFNTVCAQQKELGRLAQKSKADRKRLVLGMLGIDALDRAIHEAGNMRRTSQARVEALQERMPGLADAEAEYAQAVAQLEAARETAAAGEAAWRSAKDALAQAQAVLERAQQVEAERSGLLAGREAAQQDLRHLQAACVDLEKRREAAQAAAQQAHQLAPLAEQVEQRSQALEDVLAQHHAQQRLRDAQDRVAKLRQELEAIQVPEHPDGLLEASTQNVSLWQERVETAQVQVTVLEAQARDTRQRLERISALDAQAPCPVCERPLDGHAVDLRAHLQEASDTSERRRAAAKVELEEARKRRDEARAAAAAAEAAARRHEQAKAARARIEEVLGRAVDDHSRLVSQAPPQPPDIASARHALAEAQAAATRRATLLATASRLSQLIQEHDGVRRRMDEASGRIAAADEALARLPPSSLEDDRRACEAAAQAERQREREHAGAVQAVALAGAALETARARKQEAVEAKAALQEALLRHREWQVLAGVRGAGLLERFRTHLVSRIGPAVAAEASRLLARFTNGRYTELLLDDDYEVYVTENGVPYHLDRFSGGESDLVHLALRLAVSRLLVERSGGAEIRFLALDEVFGSLDEQRRASVLAALHELGTLYSQVLLVTHHEDMREALDHTLVVEEEDGTAVVRMHNG